MMSMDLLIPLGVDNSSALRAYRKKSMASAKKKVRIQKTAKEKMGAKALVAAVRK